MSSKRFAGEVIWSSCALGFNEACFGFCVFASSFKFSHIVVREPLTGNPKIFKMLALPFGSIKSVHSFLRVAHSLWFLATCALDVLWTNYFDDFVCCCPKSESKHLSMTVHAFFHILGWTFAEAGSKAIDFDGVCKALGVTIDVSLMHQGRVLVDNTESRKRELGDFIDHVVTTRKLNSADALKLRGRMQFTSGQLFGRVAKVTSHAYRSGSTEASESLISSLVFFKTFLLVSPSLSQTWTVFTDASYEQDETGVPTAGFGGVLVSPSGKPTNFFSFELSGKDLEKLNPTAKKTAIFQCEFFAVLVALNLWRQQLTN